MRLSRLALPMGVGARKVETKAEDGPIAEKYQLIETEPIDYKVRTEKNVADSDGTLILYRERFAGAAAPC